MKKTVLALSAMMITILALTACFGGPADPTKSPEEMVRDAIQNSMDVKSHTYSASLVADLKMGEEVVTGKVTFGGEQDMKDLANPRFSMKIAFNGKTAEFPEQSGNAELMMDGGNIYFILSKISDFDGNLPEEAVAAFLGKWYYMPLPEEALGQLAMATEPGQLEKAKQLLLDNFFLTDIEYVGVKGQDYRYKVGIDKDVLVQYLMASSEMSGQAPTSEEVTALRASLENISIESYILVDSDTFIFSGWDGSVVIDIEEEGGKIDFEIGMKNFDKDVKITVPADAEEFNPMMLLGPAMMMGGAGALEDGEVAELDMSDQELNSMVQGLDGVEEEAVLR